MKHFAFLILFLLYISLSACSKNADVPTNSGSSNIFDSSIAVQSTKTEGNELVFFASDEIVDRFFSNYNDIAEVGIPADKIEKGNIKTKALVYIGDLSMEVVHAQTFLSISISSSVDNESTTLYAVFRDTIKSMREELGEEDIFTAWNEIHESGYLVENYDFNGIKITYVPAKELSWGTSDLRVDLFFSL